MNSPDDRDASSRLADLAPELASTVVRVAGDIALVVGDDGVIHSLAEGSAPLHTGVQNWVGRPWAEMVAADTRPKVALLLQEAQQFGVSRRRELNHHVPEGGDIPVSWAAVRLGDKGPVLAVGRDLRAVSAIQQRFMDSQLDLERDYWQRRHAENHYHQLFDVAHDAVLVVDAMDFTIREANPAAAALLDQAERALAGQALRPLIEAAQHAALDELLITARTTGRAAEMRLRLAGSGIAIDISTTPFRADGQLCLLLRARQAVAAADDGQSAADFIGQTPDSVVVTDISGRVQWANPAFVELCEAPDERWLQGRNIADVLGDHQRQWQALLTRVRSRGVVGHAPLRLQLPGAAALSADVSAALLADGEQERIGFTLRRLPGPATASAAASADAGDRVNDLSGLLLRLGHAALPELLAQAATLAETHLVQAALRDSRSLESAAALLRVAPADLKARLQRLGLTDTAESTAQAPGGSTPWLN